MLEPLLNITHECLEAAYCAFNDVYQPTIDYGNHEFWGLSEFWYTFEDIFSLGMYILQYIYTGWTLHISVVVHVRMNMGLSL